MHKRQDLKQLFMKNIIFQVGNVRDGTEKIIILMDVFTGLLERVRTLSYMKLGVK